MNPKMALIAASVAAVLLFPTGFYVGMNMVISQKREELKQWRAAQKPPEPPAEEKPSVEKSTTVQDFKNVSKELETWKKELTEEKQRLLKMDEDILRRESLLKAEREALDKERAKILQMQKDLESQILKVEESDTAGLKDLAGLFTKMKPDETVNFLRMFPEDQATKVMTYLPKKQLVKILETWSKSYPDDRQKILRVTSEIRRVVQSSSATKK